jgi:predicted DCC family thiol-disulfide oxidoreductase YuxK
VSAPTLLYDQSCGFCRWSVSRFLAWDATETLRAVPIQSEEAGRLLCNMEPGVRMASAHLVSADGHVYSAGAVADPLLRMLRGGRPFAAVARTLPGTTERVYRLVARNRHRLGRLLGAAACAEEPESTGSPRSIE